MSVRPSIRPRERRSVSQAVTIFKILQLRGTAGRPSMTLRMYILWIWGHEAEFSISAHAPRGTAHNLTRPLSPTPYIHSTLQLQLDAKPRQAIPGITSDKPVRPREMTQLERAA